MSESCNHDPRNSALKPDSEFHHYIHPEPDNGVISTPSELHDESDDPTVLSRSLFASLSIDEHNEEHEPQAQFDPTRCLFCPYSTSVDLEENVEHMRTKHGLFIPNPDRMIVDIETLVQYLHLIIFGYFECLYCGSQRSSPVAAQQHMLGKGHCRIDISKEDSEFRDFYNYDCNPEDGSNENESRLVALNSTHGIKADSIHVDKSLRLSSGKVLSHRSQITNRNSRATQHRIAATSQCQSETQVEVPGVFSDEAPAMAQSRSSSSRIIKREAAFVQQLASLRLGDRNSLSHLPISKQRALIAKSKRQVEYARRAENELILRIQLKANP